MKKLVAILALVIFMGGMTAPVLASSNSALLTIEMADKDPKKAEKKTEKKAEAKKSDAKHSADCTTEKKSSDCTTEKKSSDCEKK